MSGRRWILTLTALIGLSGCAANAEYPLSVPSLASDDFYARLEAVAEGEQLSVAREGRSLDVATPDGDTLRYRQRPNGVVLLVPANSDLDAKAQRQRRERLKALSDKLIEKTRTPGTAKGPDTQAKVTPIQK